MAVTIKDFRTDEASWWCPGCGDFGVLASLQRALVDLGRAPEDVAIVAGIGCSGKIGNYINGYNLHVVHGRTMPAALGVKLANRELTVVAAGGDGDGFAIGMGHFIHQIRRNPDITYVVMDNQIYGLTKGQTSPRSDSGFVTRSTPEGNLETPVEPLSLAIAAGATFVAQGFSANPKQLAELIKKGIEHKGFALINTFSPCVTFNKIQTYDFFRQHIVNLDEDPEYDAQNKGHALNKIMEHGGMVTGVIYHEPDSVSYEDRLPGFKAEGLVNQDWRLPKADFDKILASYK